MEISLTKRELRAALICERVLPALDRGHDHIAFDHKALIHRFGEVDAKYLIEFLGPGWSADERQDELILVRNIPVALAKAQINKRLGPQEPPRALI